MVQTAESPRLDSRVALVGGAGVVVAHLILLRPFGWWHGEVAGLIVAVALFVGFAVIAFGLPGAGAGLLGPSRLARWALFVSGALAVVGVVAAWFFPRGSVDFSSAGVRAFGIVLGCVSLAQLLALVTAAVFAVSSRGASTSARRGITLLAVLAVATELISLAWGLLPVDALQTFATATAWQGRLFDVVALCVGVGIAWPWLAPQVDRLTAAGARARDRWVDSTP